MVDMVNDVRAFMVAGEQALPDRPKVMEQALIDLRRALIVEEVEETLDAFHQLEHAQTAHERFAAIVALVDGGIDILYVTIGMLLALGVDVEAAWTEVQRSNMDKCVDGKLVKNAMGKVVKPEGWSPPDLNRLVLEQMHK